MKIRKGSFLRGVLVSLAVFALLFVAGLSLLGGIDSASVEAEMEYVNSAVRSAVLTCYAVEGAYPSDLEYLKTHYGLSYDEDRYIVAYDAFASNLMPSITVMQQGVDDR